MCNKTAYGYCDNCPIAETLDVFDRMLKSGPADELEDSSVEILSMPSGISEEEIEYAAKAFSMSDREAFQYGVSEENLNNMRREQESCHKLLGEYATKQRCSGPKIGETLDGPGNLICGSTLAYSVHEQALANFNRYIWGE